MSKELIFYSEHHITSREAAAKRLRDLADKIESTHFHLGDHAVALPESVNFKLEYDQEKDEEMAGQEFELEMELRWEPWEKMPAFAEKMLS